MGRHGRRPIDKKGGEKEIMTMVVPKRFKKGDILQIEDVICYEGMYRKGDLFEVLVDPSNFVLVKVRHLRSGREQSLGTYRFVLYSRRQETYEYALGDMVGLELYPIKVIYNDPATIFFYKDPITGKEKKVVAKCHPDDIYDKEVGRRVAILKALYKEIPRIIKHETK